MNIIIKPSSKADKKFDAIVGNKTIPFGSRGMSDYTKHKDNDRKHNYLQRHKHDHFTNPLHRSFYGIKFIMEQEDIFRTYQRYH